MSSNTAGTVTLVLESTFAPGAPTRIASEDITMDDLLQAKYEKKSSLSLFGGKMKVNFEEFLFQVNKK
jgi:Ras GTPase-activating-like protein IQGAP2/3